MSGHKKDADRYMYEQDEAKKKKPLSAQSACI